MKTQNVQKSILSLAQKGLSFALITLVLISHLACTKKRDPSFPEGAGLDLLAIADYDSKIESLVTGEAKSNVFYTSSEFTAGNDSKKIKMVSYTSSAPLFPQDIEFSGLVKSHYKLIYKVTAQKLVIYRNGPEDSIAQEEKISGQIESDKTLSVPIVTYPITGFYKVLVAKDENGDKTTRLREQSVQTKEEATHFRISRIPEVVSFKERSEYIVKSDYFDGAWYTSSVVSKVSEESTGALGKQISYDSKWESADKIQFIRIQDNILGLNSNYDKRIKFEDDNDKLNNLATVIKFPTKYLDTDTSINKDSVRYSSDAAKLRSFKERTWALVDFKKASSELISEIVKSQGSDPILSNFRMSDEFFMFSLQFKGARITISFLRESALKKQTAKEYSPRVYFYNDFKHFGLFATNKKSLKTFEKYRIENFETNQFINRFHPEEYKTANGETRRRIRFFMTEDSTTEPALIKTVKDSLGAWDFAFKQAGLNDVDVYLDESQRVALGDIRFNAINMVRTLTSSSLFGYGPSIADPDTGQIVSATTNIHVTSIRDSIVGSLRNYLRHKRGEMNRNYPLGSDKDSNNVSFSEVTVASIARLVSRGALDKDSSNIIKYGHSQCDFGTTSGNLIGEIESTAACAPLMQYANSTKNKSRISCENGSVEPSCKEIDLLIACAEALIPNKLVGTLLHELGHNFGLRHNFAASTDKANYAHKFDENSLKNIKNYSCPSTQKKSSVVLANSSSVMEYAAPDESRLTFVGPYDVETLRYSYDGKIMDDKCELRNLDTKFSIDENKITRLEMKFCTDEHVLFNMDPLCQPHDSGASPLEIVRNLKKEYNSLFAIQNFKYDRALSPSPEALRDYKAAKIFDRMRLIYEQWRVYLADFIGHKNANLEVYDSDSFRKELDKMMVDTNFKKHYENYFEATRELFEFFLDISFLPDRFCVVKLKNQKFELFELVDLIKTVENKYGAKEISCTSPRISQEIANVGTFVREAGFYFENQKASSDEQSMVVDLMNVKSTNSAITDIQIQKDKVESYWDIIGTRLDKDLAKDAAIKRSALGFKAKQKGLRLTMMDEPTFRDRFAKKLTNRILFGIAYNDLFPGAVNFKETEDSYFEKWSSENTHIRQAWEYMNLGFKDGNDKDLTYSQRTRAWEIVRIEERAKALTYPPEQRYEDKDGTFRVAPTKESTVTISLFARLKELQKMQKESPERFQLKRLDYEAQMNLIAHIIKVSL